ncbi:hypothetical protein [Alienimonas chondri]|uniref:DUF4175 domain-containing protein n=1 Tax=Alienimonas chondri TaxID=2681879 RepID=A0ABX1VAP7_9PLAN|nr:hypothetical protein [Alienimonas chondri]NNJ24575.1 hypothetical protein [Alienimonas chondri]
MPTSSPTADAPTADEAPRAAGISAAELDRRLAAHRRGTTFARFFARLPGPLALALLIAGAAALALRLRNGDPEPAVWIAAAGAAIAGLYAGWRAKRDRVAPRDAAATLDTALRSGGLLMTLADLPADARPSDWLARIEPRRDRWRDARPPLPLGRAFRTLVVPTAFAALAWAAPIESGRESHRGVDRTVAGDRLTGELAETLAALAAGGNADPAALASAWEDLHRLEAAIGEGGPSGSQLEAADALRERMLGAVATSGFMEGENAGRLADSLVAGADLLAGSGLLESDAVRDAAAAAGVPDPAMLNELLATAGANREAIERLAAGMTDEQRAALVSAGARLAAGETPTDLLEALPPGLAKTMARAVSDAGVGSPDTPSFSPLAAAPPLDLPLPDGASEAGTLAGRAFVPGFAAASDLANALWGGNVPATADSPPVTPAAVGSLVTAPAMDAPATVERPASPSQRIAAGRPVPPRLRGVVQRYFSDQTPPPPADD